MSGTQVFANQKLAKIIIIGKQKHFKVAAYQVVLLSHKAYIMPKNSLL